ncbi:MAG: solute:sodium symporter family transporter [Saprospiraceae bacterium]|nr:solute:sodium symporter family transporter [Saprospiraceae bacterium]
MLTQVLTFLLFTGFVAFIAFRQIRSQHNNTSEGYFLGGRSLTAVVIAGSLLLTNISTEHLIGMNGSAYRNGAIIIAWEVTSAIALVVAAIYFAPRYLKMGITTIPQFLGKRFDENTRGMIAGLLIISFVCTILPIVLYTGALNVESIFNLSELIGASKQSTIVITILIMGSIGSAYAIFGGLKTIAVTDTINGIGLLILGLLVPIMALGMIGDGNIISGLTKVYNHAPAKFNVVSDEVSIGKGSRESILPFSTLFTGLIIIQLYFWTMHQSIIQRVLGAISLKEAQKGLLLTGLFKILIPLIVAFPGIIAFYYFGDKYYENQDEVYPLLVKEVLPDSLTGLFVAVLMGAIFSTFNSVLNSAATVFTLDIAPRFNKLLKGDAQKLKMGKQVSIILAVGSIIVAPFVANAPAGIYQLLQQLNGIFFIPIASVIIAGFLFPRVSAFGAKCGLAFGLMFYIVCNFVLEVDIHFVHLLGIEFVLNICIMHLASLITPNMLQFRIMDVGVVDVQNWKHLRLVSIFLIIITLLIYILLGNVGA